jgi:heat shock protein 4
MKLLVGRKFDDAEVQAELKKANFKATAMANGGVGINVMYNDEEIVVPAEHFLAMMLVKAREVVNGANGNAGVGDCVIGVPASFDDAQRRGVLNACNIASMNCLKVVNETTAIALSYGIFKSAKKLFSETDKTFVMFLDLGYTMFTVSIVEFMQEHMKIKATVCESNLGGRDYDNQIIEFLCEEFEAKTKINVRENKKALMKLAVAAEKAKKFLSPDGVTDAPCNVECLAEDMDLNAKLTKEEFEKRSQHLTDRLSGVVAKALEESGLAMEAIAEVEIVGGGSRVGCVKKSLGAACSLDPAAMNYGLKTTMNADEAVARGAALQCAMLSSRMKVKPFNMVDTMYYGVVASYDATSTEANEDGKEGEKSSSAQIYKRGDELPHKPRRLTFRKKTADFTVSLAYDATYPGPNKTIGSYLIKVPAGTPPQDVRVTFNIDKNGCVIVQSAEMLQEIVEEEAPAAPVAASTEGEGKEGEAKANEGEAKADEGEGKEGEVKEGEGKEGEEKKADAAPKKRFRKTDLEVSISTSGLSSDEVKAGIELEASMAFEDRLIIETADKRNELEAYIYSMRDKLDRELKPYAQAAESDALKSLLMNTEEWLYDEDDVQKSAYQAKLDELHKGGDVMERRVYEENNRQQALDGLSKQIEMCRKFAKNYEEKFEHITEEEREKIRVAFNATETWMHDKMLAQGEVAKNVDPVLTCEMIGKERQELFSVSNPIMTKKAPPKPAPAPAPAPAAAPAAEPAAADAKPAAEGEEKPANEGEAPMDTEDGADAKDASPTEMDTSV